ncbi:hypothetical protein Hypma_004253 [Hypsizygus marmoreus]|uniref:Uncharacterized protein n=1 Tax=Hypsizygus marmoreus TaxID=39966 RepID=A0A369J2V3_HYPMA|nr:hypothetical protein Hypma_004253 [Hypsizygus marmoreus]
MTHTALAPLNLDVVCRANHLSLSPSPITFRIPKRKPQHTTSTSVPSVPSHRSDHSPSLDRLDLTSHTEYFIHEIKASKANLKVH